ncbi:glycosyltransferase [Flavobacterium sp. DG1-102-2]|uniref:glycosyltransferase n=1 Tax=Flavobacterium sp. DG1-102-2 TaxID=3081663 RepID=UPI002949EAAE|nr:glycosyltransferase [Flavobacterium sp. DG1-102-2]MDV6168396.1 glycosyltransferase [Flavobacterium sp. DG1-102-2]
MNIITASVVLYKTSLSDIEKVVISLNQMADLKLYLIDNSPTDELRSFEGGQIIYIHNPSNPGFGAAHNIAIQKAIEEGSKYHLIVNPDAYFTGDVVTPMVNYMEQNPDVGMMMPQVLNEDGSTQNLPKLLPSPYSILMRKFKKPVSFYNKFIERYELRNVPADKIYNAPILSGCFTLLRLSAIKEVGMYDDAYFMYFEDWDLSRRMHEKYRTIYYPLVSVYHGYESGANKSSRLFKIFIKSAITYFSKWGWFFDSERKRINTRALSQFK